MGSYLRTETVSDLDGLSRLSAEWRRLGEQDPEARVFSRFEWVHALWSERALEPMGRASMRPQVVVVRREDHAAAIAPLALSTSSPARLKFRKLEFPAAAISDYQNFLLAERSSELLASIAQELAAQQESWDVAELRHFREDSPTPGLLQQALSASGLRFRMRQERACAYIPIDSDWRTYLGKRSHRMRKTFRNHANRFQQLAAEGGRVRIVSEPHKEPELLVRMMELERRKRVKKAPTLYMFQDSERFYRALFEVFGPAESLYAAVMEKGEQLIAYELGFREGPILLAHAKAYDPEYGRFSPGAMLIAAVYEWGFQAGYREYDFGRGDEEYKQLFTPHARNTVRFEIWGRSARSRLLAWLYFSLRPRIYELRSRMGLGYVPRWEL